MSSTTRVGFIGLGIMGSPMARNLAAKGFPVTVWNRSAERARAVERHGVTVADSPHAVAAAVDIVCTCVADPPALEEVVLGPRGVVHGLPAGGLLIDFSTVSVELDVKLAGALAAKGADFIDAPVTGSRTGAEEATLVIMAGGSDAAMARARPVFEAVGQKVVHCGPVGAGTQVKLAGNALIAAMLEAFSEGFMLTRAAGVDPRRFLEVVMASGYRSPYFELKARALLEDNHATAFSIDLMFKDLSLFLDNATRHRVPVPTAAAVREVYALARAAGKGDQDISAVVTVLDELRGRKR